MTDNPVMSDAEAVEALLAPAKPDMPGFDAEAFFKRDDKTVAQDYEAEIAPQCPEYRERALRFAHEVNAKLFDLYCQNRENGDADANAWLDTYRIVIRNAARKFSLHSPDSLRPLAQRVVKCLQHWPEALAIAKTAFGKTVHAHVLAAELAEDAEVSRSMIRQHGDLEHVPDWLLEHRRLEEEDRKSR